jgi:serine phosphatase RsbU (regulator of sigma subunit)
MNSLASLDSPGFRARLAESERLHLKLMTLAFVVGLVNLLLRRLSSGVIMSSDAVFFPTLFLLLAGTGYQGLRFLQVRHREQAGTTARSDQPIWSLLADLLIPAGMLLILQEHSPLGRLQALSAPILMLMPFIILLSVLRLRPWLSFLTGVIAAVFHLGLAVWAIKHSSAPKEQTSVLFAYPFMLLMIGGAAAGVAWMARRYVIEATNEAILAERANKERALVERELQVAHDIQMGLLPKDPPSIPTFEIAGRCRPAARAGGDYFDWQQMPDGRFLVVIADVTGHGVGPALVTAVCRAYARASATRSPDSGQLLEQLNQLICDDVKGARFITMYVLMLDPEGEVEMLSAGHGPTFLYRVRDGRVEEFGADGLPLGILEGCTYGPLRRIRMEPGDVMLLATDGYTEYARAGDSEMFGTERMASLLQRHATKSSADFIDVLDREVKEFAVGGPQEDDMTAVVIRRVREGTPGTAATGQA